METDQEMEFFFENDLGFGFENELTEEYRETVTKIRAIETKSYLGCMPNSKLDKLKKKAVNLYKRISEIAGQPDAFKDDPDTLATKENYVSIVQRSRNLLSEQSSFKFNSTQHK